ncbi:MAG: thiamine pyrophosphate-dependent enzyme [Maricaulaceae bacterium]|jgi:sulfopyruvate decarboxylase subunit beta
MSTQKDAAAEVVKAARAADALIVADIGSQSGWLKAVEDDPRHLYLSGPMGLASSVALGVALAHPKRAVVAICGDGALAMNLTSLVTIAHASPKNLTIVVIDNAVYDYTKQVVTPSIAISWTDVAAGCFGRENVCDISQLGGRGVAKGDGPLFVVAKVALTDETPPRLGLAPDQIARRFAAAAAG